MKKDLGKNIFDIAGGQKKPAKKKKKQTSKKKLKSIEKEFDQLFSLKESIDVKLSDLHEKLGLDKKQVSDYLDNPGNFSEKEWKIIKKYRDQLRKKTESMIVKTGTIPNKRKKTKKKKAKKKMISVKKKWFKVD